MDLIRCPAWLIALEANNPVKPHIEMYLGGLDEVEHDEPTDHLGFITQRILFQKLHVFFKIFGLDLVNVVDLRSIRGRGGVIRVSTELRVSDQGLARVLEEI